MNDKGHAATGRSDKPGDVIRALRKRKGLTLAQVSAKTGLAISSLSKLEKGFVSLSYDKLMLLSRGLDVDVASLLEPNADAPDRVPAGNGRRVVQRAGDGQLVETHSYVQRYLSTELLSKRMTPIVVEIRSRTLQEFIAEFGDMIRHPGEEFTLVLEGEVEFHSEVYAPVRLKAGDSIYFDSEMGHAYLNALSTPCRVVCVCSSGSRESGLPDMFVNASGRPGTGQAAPLEAPFSRTSAPAKGKARR